ncbi:MAG TPA: amidohydrolase family protein [Acidimicrobiales bacterium]|nr:amidohydrolase family protein [Acidimicrobiales bacterium]
MTETTGPMANGSTRLTVMSADSHVGPRLEEDLRQYCPKQHLEEFDRFSAANAKTMDEGDEPGDLSGRSTQASEVSKVRRFVNRRTPGHYDVATRLREMDWEGVAAEVIFHGSQNTEVYPFGGRREWSEPDTKKDLELVAVGHRMYNRWLADFCSVAPERLIGLAYVPMWDVDLAVEELAWAAGRGLKGVNFPAPREGIAEYDHPQWEPFWSACEDLDMNLSTHIGLPGNDVFGPQAMAMSRLDDGWPCRRGMVRMIFGGVFARHPGLKLVLTELQRGWWRWTMRELDFVYSSPSEALRAQVPEAPSEYMTSNVFIGASFMPPSAVHEAIEEDYVDQVIWGRDYPHGEGTYKYPETASEESQTKHYLRWAFQGVPAEVAVKMLSATGIYAYNLDRTALERVASRIGPTLDELVQPLERVPAEWANNLVDVHTGEVAEGFVPIMARGGVATPS